MNKPTKPTDLMPRSFGGLKENYSTSLQQTGVEPNVPVIYHGKNFNYEKNAIGQELDYCEQIVDFINGIPIGKTITVDNNNQLQYANLAQDVPIATTETAGIVKPDGETITVDEDGVITAKSMSRNIGEIVASTLPLTDAGLHLLDGSLIQGSGSYSDFVDYIANLYNNSTQFTTNLVLRGITDNNGVISGFVNGTTNAQIKIPFSPSTNDWEIVVQNTTGDFSTLSSSLWQGIIGRQEEISNLTLLITDNRTLSVWIGSVYNQFDIAEDVQSILTVEPYTSYYFKVKFDGLKYTVDVSTDKTTWTNYITITSSTPIYSGGLLYLGIDTDLATNTDVNLGSFDLKEGYININGSRFINLADPIGFSCEQDWQYWVNMYGVNGMYVYDSVNNTVRLPKITGFIEGTDSKQLGYVIPAGLPNIYAKLGGYFNGASYVVPSNTQGVRFVNEVGCCSNNISDDKLFNTVVDASLSSSIYGNSTTVQPQSINVYYYVVVATTTKTNIQVDIDEIATDLNGKADVDLTNVNNSGTSRSAGWAMPSDTYTDLTLGATGTTYTAPANGYFFLYKEAGSANQYITMTNNSSVAMSIHQWVPQSGGGCCGFLPAKKGDIVTITYTATGNTIAFKYVYAQGSESEAS